MPRMRTLGAALLEGAASVGLPTAAAAPRVHAELDFGEFLSRQRSFLQVPWPRLTLTFHGLRVCDVTGIQTVKDSIALQESGSDKSESPSCRCLAKAATAGPCVRIVRDHDTLLELESVLQTRIQPGSPCAGRVQCFIKGLVLQQPSRSCGCCRAGVCHVPAQTCCGAGCSLWQSTAAQPLPQQQRALKQRGSAEEPR